MVFIVRSYLHSLSNCFFRDFLYPVLLSTIQGKLWILSCLISLKKLTLCHILLVWMFFFLVHSPTEYDRFLDLSIWPIDGILTGTTLPGQIGFGNNNLGMKTYIGEGKLWIQSSTSLDPSRGGRGWVNSFFS